MERVGVSILRPDGSCPSCIMACAATLLFCCAAYGAANRRLAVRMADCRTRNQHGLSNIWSRRGACAILACRKHMWRTRRRASIQAKVGFLRGQRAQEQGYGRWGTNGRTDALLVYSCVCGQAVRGKRPSDVQALEGGRRRTRLQGDGRAA